MNPSAGSCIVKNLPPLEGAHLRQVLEAHHWEITDAPYAFFKASRDKTNMVFYQSGKLVIQGKGASDFVEFILEPEITGCPEAPAEEAYEDHAGMDESGKGDFFGPLVACAAFVKKEEVPLLADAGVCDCKLIKSDVRLRSIAEKAMQIIQGRIGIVIIGPEAYNRMYRNFRSLNPMLAWAHSRALENLLEKVPECPRALADQFGDERLIRNALGERGKKIVLDQRTKAESDMAVAAASVFARAAFLKKLEELGKTAGVVLPKGAGLPVDETAKHLADQGGEELLSRFAKMHFRTALKALGRPLPPPADFSFLHHRTPDHRG